MIKVFSKRLRELRKKSGYTQNQLAEILGTGRTSISNWENEICIPHLDMIKTLASVFGVKADYLLGSMPDYPVRDTSDIKLDFSKLNNAGVNSMTEHYRLLLLNKKYTKTTE